MSHHIRTLPTSHNFTEVLAQSFTSPFDSTMFYYILLVPDLSAILLTRIDQPQNVTFIFFVFLCAFALWASFHLPCCLYLPKGAEPPFCDFVHHFLLPSFEVYRDRGSVRFWHQMSTDLCLSLFEFLKSSPDDKEESDGKWKFHLQKEPGNTAGHRVIATSILKYCKFFISTEF